MAHMELVRQNARTLPPAEKWWADNYTIFLSRGYALRKRYQPGWIPTWDMPGNELAWPMDFEDAYMIRGAGNVLDAIRVSDGRKVVLKVAYDQREVDLTTYLGRSLPQTDASPNNRAVSVLDVFSLSGFTILVLPFLREFDDPAFECVGQVTDAILQFLTGMQYLHDHNVAHRDLGPGNLMMDASRVIPRGWHICAPWLYLKEGHRRMSSVHALPRHAVPPVEYFIIDFGLSTYFPPDISPQNAQAVGKFGKYCDEIPELSDTVPYNPFKIDIYQLGHVILDLVDTYHGLDGFRGLAKRMMARNPDERPWAPECIEIFKRLASRTNSKAPVMKRSSGSWVKYAGKQLRIMG